MSASSNKKSKDQDDDFTTDFKENFRKIKEKKLKLAQISNFLSPSSQPQKPQANSGKKDDDSSKYFSKTAKKDDDVVTCPVCSLDLAKLTANERDSHVNRCLEQPTTSSKLDDEFKYKPTRKFSRTESSDDINEKKQPTKNEEKCQDAKSKINETLLKDAVPNCPICGKVFHSFNVFELYRFISCY